MTRRRITVLDVAHKAGVSQGSVSRVLTGKNWVSDELRAKVEKAAHELGYSPNPHAQGLKSRKSKAVAALVSDISNPLHGVFLAAAEEILSAAGYLLFVSSTKSDLRRELQLIKAYGSGRVDGLIVAHTDESDRKLFRALERVGLPIVFHDRESLSLGDAVVSDHKQGAYEATRHLLELGHTRIALMTPPAAIRPGRERILGYERALREAGLESADEMIAALDASDEKAYDVACRLLSLRPEPPTALICLGTQMLAGVLQAADNLRLRVPKDLSLIGIGDTDLVRLHRPPITTVRWDIGECGRIAARLLLRRLGEGPSNAQGATPYETVMSHTQLVKRGSCAHPRTR